MDTNNLTGYAQVVEEIQGGQVVRQYTYGDALISQRQNIAGNWQVSFYGFDGHGSVRFLTDSTGTKTDAYDYDAFGTLINQTGTTPNTYLYCGEQFDPDLGMYYLRARYLNPGTGRFWTMDGFEGNKYDPASLHKYLYSGSDPINKIDPSGHFNLIELAITVGIILVLVTTTLAIVKEVDDFLSTPLTDDQEAQVSAAIDYLAFRGFLLEAIALGSANIRLSFAFKFKPDDFDSNYEGAYAVTAIHLNKVILYPRFFQSLGPYEGGITKTHIERAAVLLHEAYHLLGGNEHIAYANVWINREQLGFTETYLARFKDDFYEQLEAKTQKEAPELFK